MKNYAQRVLSVTSDFVSEHKTAITIAATAIVTTTICVALTRALDSGYSETVEEFLTEKGLNDEFIARYFEEPSI